MGVGARRVEVAAVASSAAFAGGALLSQTVVVPSWQAVPPAVFLRHFSTWGPATGATVFPFEIAATGLLILSTRTALATRQRSRWLWGMALLAMLGTLVLLPVYFVGADLAMLPSTFPAARVRPELVTWSRWNELRTALALTAAVLAAVAAAVSAPGDA
jgi:uncharacterized membrane protein